jgi:hypothetical protein
MGSIRIRVGVLLRAKQVGVASYTICWSGQASARKLAYTSGFGRVTLHSRKRTPEIPTPPDAVLERMRQQQLLPGRRGFDL